VKEDSEMRDFWQVMRDDAEERGGVTRPFIVKQKQLDELQAEAGKRDGRFEIVASEGLSKGYVWAVYMCK